MRHFTRTIVLILIATLFISCGKDEDVFVAKRTMLVYMVASNNLGSLGYDREDLTEMEYAIKNYGTNGCRFLIFHVTNTEPPELFEFVRNNGRVSRKVLKVYDKQLPATSVMRMSEVFADMLSEAPAKEYGLILWSHASGWALRLPKNTVNLKSPKQDLIVRNFGMDRTDEMRLDELEKALPAETFNYVYADVCYMGAVEVAYQLRHKINYLIASPTITLGEGMPYHINVPEFCSDKINLKKICDNTFNYYDSKSGINQSCTISLTDCSKLEPLAAVCAEVLQSTAEIENVNEIQNYIAPSDGKCIFFDFGQYIRERLKYQKNSVLINEFDGRLNDAVVYKKSTREIYNELLISKSNYSGLSVYIEGTGGQDNDDYYKTTDWYKATRKN